MSPDTQSRTRVENTSVHLGIFNPTGPGAQSWCGEIATTFGNEPDVTCKRCLEVALDYFRWRVQRIEAVRTDAALAR